MTLEELVKLKQENYPLFVETVKGLNEEIPKYKKITLFQLRCCEAQNDPFLKSKISNSVKISLSDESVKKKISDQSKRPELKEARAKAGKATAKMNFDKKYAIYKGVAYTRSELIELLEVSKTVLWDIKRKATKNRFNLEFL
jgi:hypothetical protein